MCSTIRRNIIIECVFLSNFPIEIKISFRLTLIYFFILNFIQKEMFFLTKYIFLLFRKLIYGRGEIYHAIILFLIRPHIKEIAAYIYFRRWNSIYFPLDYGFIFLS